MEKHAYLIIAHHQLELLKKLLALLDDRRNDIYIHLGKNMWDDKDILQDTVKESALYFVSPMQVNWGGYSQIECELRLFSEASKRKYSYYHLLSGVDLPLKTQDEIHDFFQKHNGKEFIYFCPQSFCRKSLFKCAQYHFLQEKIGRRQKGILYLIEKVLLTVQKKLRISRLKENIEYAMGANWVSITHELVCYILDKQKDIYEMFHATLCCDEFFIQTLVWNSPYFKARVFSLENDYFACLRLIDWSRGKPYIWRKSDYEQLIRAPHLFARKFDEETDSEIIDCIYDFVGKDKIKGDGI